ncbi:MAG: hypothetical protein C0595_14190 [Marinilabiliales bacterium]|nr:MAG: hypothetical protein C0595_14190 [Marinilabiliales bacterium]
MSIKKQIPFFIFTVVILFAFSNCKKNNTSDPLTCNLSKQTQLVENMTITFSATQTGDGEIKTLTYKVGSDENKIDNPTLPWEIDVEVSAGSFISIEAVGTTKNGSLEVSMKGSNGSTTIEASDYCEQQSN